jgi:hypothetical protein
MKIAFCFLTRGDLLQPKVWEAFFVGAEPTKHSVYCHPKQPADVTSPVLKDRIIDDLVPTLASHVSIVRATLNLFTQAYADDNDNQYFVLLSESTIPIASFANVYKGIERQGARSIVTYSVPPPGSEHHRRLATIKHPERFASAFFYHDTWIILHRRHVRMLLDAPSLLDFADVFTPDEHYFMNVLVHLAGVRLDQFVNHRATFVNWREKDIKLHTSPATGQIVGRTIHPKTYYELSAADLAEAHAGHCWFFRKVAAACNCDIVLKQLTLAGKYEA